MPSLGARLFLFVLRNRHLLRLSLKKETGAEWAANLPAIRARAAKSTRLLGRIPKGMTVRPETISGVPGEWIAPEGAPGGSALLYFHGGGYVLGTIEAHRGIVAKFARAAAMPAYLFGYRLAPEHPFPAALDDALAVYRGLLDQGRDPARLVLAGDSAGGGLCLALLLRLRDLGLPLPAGAAVLSPWTDLTCSGDSLVANAAACLAPTGSWLACREHYAAGQDVRNPYLSPLFGRLDGLPPLLAYAGGAETLLSDATRFAEAAGAAGVDVRLEIGEGLCHCYPACAPIFPEATRAMADIGRFLRDRAGR